MRVPVRRLFDDDAPGFGSPKRQAITPDEEFERVAQRSGPEVLDLFPLDQPHLHQSDRDGVVAGDLVNAGPVSRRERVEGSHGRFTSTRTIASSSPRKLSRW